MVPNELECNKQELPCLATPSFITFAIIEEDTSSYHRRYDFFVSKFNSTFHSNHQDTDRQTSLTTAVLKGQQGFVRKTDSDDQQVNILDRTPLTILLLPCSCTSQLSQGAALSQEFLP